jgi:hypothetical protein
VRPTTEGEARHTVVCIHNATQNDKRDLLEMSTKTPAEMSKFLASEDVSVTNTKDKEMMLPIVGKTDERVREMMSGTTAAELQGFTTLGRGKPGGWKGGSPAAPPPLRRWLKVLLCS